MRDAAWNMPKLTLAILLLRATGLAAEGFAIEPFLQNAESHAITVKWSVREQAAFKVAYGRGEALDHQQVTEIDVQEMIWHVQDGSSQSGKPPRAAKAWVYQAHLTNLTADTGYRYEVAGGTLRSAGTFRTLSLTNTPFTFISIGDIQGQAPDACRGLVRGFAKHDPAFLICTGDMIPGMKDTSAFPQWLDFFGMFQAVIRHVPLYPACGNHDLPLDDYYTLFDLPGGGSRWYAFDFGDTHLVCLDFRKNDDMLAWCERDLERSRATWKIVYAHIPPYDLGPSHAAWGHEDYLPLFRKHGVDLMISGHDHTYQRFKPMYRRGVNDQHPITFIVAAGAGRMRTVAAPDPRLAAWSISNHYLAIHIGGGRLSGQVVSDKGRILDAFEIIKEKGTFDGRYLNGAIAEDDFVQADP